MIIPDEFFITPAQKRKELRALNKLIKTGQIDKAMIPYLNEINALPGLMTQFCCQGHKVNGGNSQGNLIIALSEKAFRCIIFARNNICDAGLCEEGCSIDFLDFDTEKKCRISMKFSIEERDQYLQRVIHKLKYRLGIITFREAYSIRS
jgi:hypothetical protein